MARVVPFVFVPSAYSDRAYVLPVTIIIIMVILHSSSSVVEWGSNQLLLGFKQPHHEEAENPMFAPFSNITTKLLLLQRVGNHYDF